MQQDLSHAATEKDKAVRYSMSNGFLNFLSSNNISIAMTSYQSGRLYLLGRNPKGGLMVNEQCFKKAMGLHVKGNAIYMATHAHICRMENILKPGQWMEEIFTQCYLPRTIHFTGCLDSHDVGVTKNNEIIFVNTAYNCLAKLSETHSFQPIWHPHFISKIVAEDRCHLNGLAMENGEAAYVTAISRSDSIDGWRDRRADGGIVMDVSSNDIICNGLSMPHSPRVYNNKLWILNSGCGEFGYVDKKTQKFEPITFCPGFLRGLAFHGRYALVGLSRPRYNRFEGLPLDERLKSSDSEPWTGLQIVDLETGTCVHWFRLDGPVEEMYDVAALPGIICPKSISFSSDESLGIITQDE